MARGDQLGRQWKIIQTLMSSHAGKTAPELADELGCRPRTVYRDLEALQVGGFPLFRERIDNRNYWSLIDTAKRPRGKAKPRISMPELVRFCEALLVELKVAKRNS